MSVREERVEDSPTNNCPSRGLGVAAAAIGVGVGAALYYFFSKRAENPDGQGSTSGWRSEQPQTLHDSDWETTSERSTTDTSMNNSRCYCGCMDSSSSDSSNSTDSSISSMESLTELTITDSDETETGLDTIDSIDTSGNSLSETEWDMTDSSLYIPSHERQSVSPLNSLYIRISSLVKRNNKPVHTEAQKQRERAFRERSWTLEECSICFEIMLKDQSVVQLPCSHNFHEACLGPWLEEHQTCPMCRKPLQ